MRRIHRALAALERRHAARGLLPRPAAPPLQRRRVARPARRRRSTGGATPSSSSTTRPAARSSSTPPSKPRRSGRSLRRSRRPSACCPRGRGTRTAAGRDRPCGVTSSSTSTPAAFSCAWSASMSVGREADSGARVAGRLALWGRGDRDRRRRARRGDLDPAVAVAERHVDAQLEAERAGVELDRLGLVCDRDARPLRTSRCGWRSCSLCASGVGCRRCDRCCVGKSSPAGRTAACSRPGFGACTEPGTGACAGAPASCGEAVARATRHRPAHGPAAIASRLAKRSNQSGRLITPAAIARPKSPVTCSIGPSIS